MTSVVVVDGRPGRLVEELVVVLVVGLLVLGVGRLLLELVDVVLFWGLGG